MDLYFDIFINMFRLASDPPILIWLHEQSLDSQDVHLIWSKNLANAKMHKFRVHRSAQAIFMMKFKGVIVETPGSISGTSNTAYLYTEDTA